MIDLHKNMVLADRIHSGQTQSKFIGKKARARREKRRETRHQNKLERMQVRTQRKFGLAERGVDPTLSKGLQGLGNGLSGLLNMKAGGLAGLFAPMDPAGDGPQGTPPPEKEANAGLVGGIILAMITLIVVLVWLKRRKSK